MLDWLRHADAGPDDTRWVVLDVEASGRDASRDRLLAIAALALRVDANRAQLVLADSFEAEMPRDADAPDFAGASGAALRAFADYAGASPLLSFHASFARTLVERAFERSFGRRPRNPWLDIEHLCEVLHPTVDARSLDEWIAHFGIVCARRHDAAADAYASAELLLKLWPDLARQMPRVRFGAVAKLAAQRRWTRLIKR